MITNNDQLHVKSVRTLTVKLQLATSKATVSLMEREKLGNTPKTFMARGISTSHLKQELPLARRVLLKERPTSASLA